MEDLPVITFNDYLGIEILNYGDGLAECRIELQNHHLNTGGRVHGGVLSSLADCAAGVAVRSVRPAGKRSATTDLTIAYMRPPQGSSLTAKAEVVHAGKQLFRVEVSIHSSNKLVARCSATFMLVEPFRKA
ncbi:MAG: PaaI family thioesterase [Gammaproteobacteria bacterium]|nr:PaaI family thioesterase [Gammaproteobacteria bacterium]